MASKQQKRENVLEVNGSKSTLSRVIISGQVILMDLRYRTDTSAASLHLPPLPDKKQKRPQL